MATFDFSENNFQASKNLYQKKWNVGMDNNFIGTSQEFTRTDVSSTPTQSFLSDRPALLTAGTTALHGNTWKLTGAALRPQANKTIYIFGSFYLANIGSEICAGTSIVTDTTPYTDSTDFLHIQKLTAATGFTLRSRKASGTAYSATIGHPTLVIATWYTWALAITRDADTAGKGRVQFGLGYGLSAFTTFQYVASFDIPTQFPDTVSQAPFFNGRLGNTVPDQVAFSEFGVVVSR